MDAANRIVTSTILNCFTRSNYTYRTASGIARDAGFDVSDVREVLEGMRMKVLHRRRDGAKLYGIGDTEQV